VLAEKTIKRVIVLSSKITRLRCFCVAVAVGVCVEGADCVQVPKCLDAFPVDIHVVSGVSANVVVNPAAHGGNAPVDA
jgi:hypothetical protein